ncbi:MAG TPA: septation protein A [Burkholderiales bacterium]|nr:septation protein A [Burkholderiales bacterium]
MKFLFDLFPVILFFAVYSYSKDIYLATMVIIPATIAQVIYARLKFGKVDGMLWASLVLILVMGGLTLWLHDARFIKLKPTLLYWLFALIFLLAPFIAKRNLIQSMLSKEIKLPAQVWARLNLAWVGFFALMGALNLYVAQNYSESTWVNFKLWGMTACMLVFILAQGLFIARHVQDDRQT